MKSRFDHIQYDDKAKDQQALLKKNCEALEHYLQAEFPEHRAKTLAVIALEEFYMWCGKAIRDQQITRNERKEVQT
jgi:hypothetical protein